MRKKKRRMEWMAIVKWKMTMTWSSLLTLLHLANWTILRPQNLNLPGTIISSDNTRMKAKGRKFRHLRNDWPQLINLGLKTTIMDAHLSRDLLLQKRTTRCAKRPTIPFLMRSRAPLEEEDSPMITKVLTRNNIKDLALCRSYVRSKP